MQISWLLGLVHEKHREKMLDEALEELYEKLSSDHKHEFKKMLKGVALHIDHKEAREIVTKMNPSGEHWNMDQIEKAIADRKSFIINFIYSLLAVCLLDHYIFSAVYCFVSFD
mgnify:CR=1 FL=1